jgi:N-acetylmuramoyl-L-alanine amidase
MRDGMPGLVVLLIVASPALAFAQFLDEPPMLTPAIKTDEVKLPFSTLLFVSVPEQAFTERDAKCLADAVYYEAANQTDTGRLAVINVILNRYRGVGRFQKQEFKSICAVVQQRSRRGCQFSWYCNPRLKRKRKNPDRYEQCLELATTVLRAYSAYEDNTHSATFYHASYVRRPYWSKRMTRTVRIGQHVFYRPAD